MLVNFQIENEKNTLDRIRYVHMIKYEIKLITQSYPPTNEDR